MVSGEVLSAITKLVTVSPVPSVLGRGELQHGLKPDPNLQNAVDAVVAMGGFLDKDYAFAVVDLTDDPINTPGFSFNAPAYAGYKDTSYREIASLAKLLPLFGAYQLRSDLRLLSAQSGIADLTQLAKAMRIEYQRVGASTATGRQPWIEKMFSPLTSAGHVDFTMAGMSDQELDQKHRDIGTRIGRTTSGSHGLLGTDAAKLARELSDLAFNEQLRLMAGWSDNVAAAVVIESLGFSYLWALTKKNHLFQNTWPELTPNDRIHPPDPGGLFLARDYNHAGWSDAERTAAGAPVGRPRRGGTARSLAILMATLAQERLVTSIFKEVHHEDHVGMREMLRKTEPDFTSHLEMEDSPIGIGMAASRTIDARPQAPRWRATQPKWDYAPPILPLDPPTDLAVSKIGLEPGSNASNVLLVGCERPQPRGSIRIVAVLVGLNNVSSSKASLATFGQLMARKLDDRHKVVAPP